MSISHIIILTQFLFTIGACQGTKSSATAPSAADTKNEVVVPVDQSNLKKAYFASGCFWCVEAVYESVKGVE